MHDPAKLLPVARRAAANIVRSGFLADEASERAVHQLTLATLAGRPPTNPEAWLRAVARRCVYSLLRKGWGRTLPLESGSNAVARETAWTEGLQAERKARGADFVREHVHATLSPRQQDALHAALTCRSHRAAASSCGMQPRDFRRSMSSITRKARRLLEGPGLPPGTRSS